MKDHILLCTSFGAEKYHVAYIHHILLPYMIVKSIWGRHFVNIILDILQDEFISYSLQNKLGLESLVSNIEYLSTEECLSLILGTHSKNDLEFHYILFFIDYVLFSHKHIF